MGFLDALSNGLRGAGSVLNSQVEGQVAGEHQDKLRQQQNMKNLVAQRVIGGIENGSIDPEQGQQALAQLGVQLPPGAIGASPEAEARKTAAANEAAFRQEIAALGPGATQEQLAQVAARYSKPDAVMTSQTASLDRQQRLAAEMQARKDKLAADIEAARQRGADRRELLELQQQFQRETRQMIIDSRQAPAPSITTIADPNDPTKGQVIDARTGRVIGAAPPARGGSEKVIPAPIVKAYTENTAAIRKIDSALAALDKAPNSVGLDKAAMGDEIAQRMDPGGVEARALINDIGSLKIHDRSGAAVTAAEFPRLKPFIPKTSDNAATIKKKLGLFRKEYEAIQNDLGGIYNQEQGYKAFPVTTAPTTPGASGGWTVKEK
jgi:hypothetical protein